MTICTIAIPVFNRAQLVRAAVESALAQEAADIEILVIDNASTDGTWDALQGYCDPRLRLVRNDANIGLFGNLNRCLELAQGEYIRILCSDDRLVPGCIARELALLCARPDVNLLSAQGRQVNAANQLIGTFADDLPPGVYTSEDAIVGGLWHLAHYEGSPYNYPSGVMMRRASALQAGGFDGAFKQLGDIDLYLKIARQGPIAITRDVGCEILVHSGQTTNTLLAQGETTREWFLVVARFAQELKARGVYRKVIEQAAAGSLWFGVYFLRRRRLDTARRYWHVGRAQGLPLWTLAVSFARHVWIKVLLRCFKIRLCPPVTAEPF